MTGLATPTRFEGVCTEADQALCADLDTALRGIWKKNHVEVRLRVKPHERAFLFIKHEGRHAGRPMSMLVVEAPEGTDPIWVRAQAVKWLKVGAPDLEHIKAPKPAPKKGDADGKV